MNKKYNYDYFGATARYRTMLWTKLDAMAQITTSRIWHK